MEAVYLAMLAMLTHLQDTVFATGPPNRCLQTPGPFSPWQCQALKTTVSLFSCPTIYLITLFLPDMLFFSKDGYFPTVTLISPSTPVASAPVRKLCAHAPSLRFISQDV